MAGDEEEKGFLSRWSQRKQTARLEEAEPESERPPEPAALTEEEEEARRKELEDYVASLPEPESLTYESDFTAFFKEGVPDALKQRALRVLWRSNPTLANLDGLIDYGQDFTDAAMVVPNLKTLYRVGKGMFSDEDWAKEERKRAGLPPEPEEPAEVAEAEAAEPPQEAADSMEEPEDGQAAQAVEESAPDPELSTKEASADAPEPAPSAARGEAAKPAKPVGEGKRSALSRRWGPQA